MIPFAIPRDREIINLSQIVRVIQGAAGTKDEGTVLVEFSNGEAVTYVGDAAKFVNAEIGFALNLYRSFQQQTQSQIVTPDTAGRIM